MIRSSVIHSFVLLLLWVYCCSQIVLFGAEFTHAYARTFGEDPVPKADAVALERPTAEARKP